MEMQAAPGRIRNLSCFRARLLRQLVFCSVTKWLKFTSPYVSHSGNMTFPSLPLLHHKLQWKTHVWFMKYVDNTNFLPQLL